MNNDSGLLLLNLDHNILFYTGYIARFAQNCSIQLCFIKYDASTKYIIKWCTVGGVPKRLMVYSWRVNSVHLVTKRLKV